MSLAVQALLVGMVAFFGYLHSFMGSTMWNRPLIVSMLTGFVLGDLEKGIIVGASLELAFLGSVPIGASNPPDMTSGSIIGTAFVIVSGAKVGEAVALAIPVATFVLILNNLQMMFLLTWAAHIADKFAAEGNANKVEWVCRFASIGNKIILSFIVALSFYLGVNVIKEVLELIPEWITHGMDVAAGILPAIGFAMLAHMIITKELAAFLLVGFLLAAYLKMAVFGVALFGFAIALIFYFFGNQKQCNSMEVNDHEF